MNEIKGFPQTIRRLPRYYQVFKALQDHGIENITSSEIAPLFHLQPAQVREDVSRCGVTGVTSVGYSVGTVRKRIAKLLGIGKGYSVILVGTDGIGPAVVESNVLDAYGLVFRGAFDKDVKSDCREVKGHSIQKLSEVASFIKTHHTDIAILAVDSHSAHSTATLLIDAGIRAIWNLTDADIVTKSSVIIESVSILDSIRMLSFRMNRCADLPYLFEAEA